MALNYKAKLCKREMLDGIVPVEPIMMKSNVISKKIWGKAARPTHPEVGRSIQLHFPN
jgi:hypothetical protein